MSLYNGTSGMSEAVSKPELRIVLSPVASKIHKGAHKGNPKILIYMGVLSSQPLTEWEKEAFLSQGQKVGLYLRQNMAVKKRRAGRDWYWVETIFEVPTEEGMKKMADNQRAIIAAARPPAPKVQQVMTFGAGFTHYGQVETPVKKEVVGSMTF